MHKLSQSTRWAGKTVRRVRTSPGGRKRDNSLVIFFTDGTIVQFSGAENTLVWVTRAPNKS